MVAFNLAHVIFLDVYRVTYDDYRLNFARITVSWHDGNVYS